MKTYSGGCWSSSLNSAANRGSVLLTALVFAIIIAITLTSYLKLTTNSLALAHRSYFSDAANNLAETGLEEAVWSFNTMGNSTSASAVAAAWDVSGRAWTHNSVADAYMTSTGTGYTSVPTVTFSGGGGSGAAGVASIVSSTTGTNASAVTVWSVSGITITNQGSGYTSAPTVTITGGGGTGALAAARLEATRTLTFTGLDQGASAVVKVWVAGYDGTSVLPIVVSKAIITPYTGPTIEKTIEVYLSKNGVLPKGVVAKNGINWNGHPLANSYVSSTTPGVPPFSAYNIATARANTTVASLSGPTIDLSHGTVSGNVMWGAGVTVTGGTITGASLGNFTYSFTMPTYPINTGAAGYYNLGTVGSLPAVLPRTSGTADSPAADGKYYYFVNGATIGATTITAGRNVVIVGTNTSMGGGFMVATSGSSVGSAKIYIDGPVSPGNSAINSTSWAGALEIYTSTVQNCTISGNGGFYGCLFAPNAALVGNGGGNNDQDLCGSFVVGSITSNGHMCFHYDEGLGAASNPKPWSLTLWRELQTAADRAVYASQLTF